MSERSMRGRVVRALSALNAVAVENPALPGTPDVNYVEGWIELKWLEDWPTNEETVVRFDHFTPQQRTWHLRRRLANGQSWFLIQCKQEWLLLDGAVAIQYVNACTRSELYSIAEAHTTSGLNEKELMGWISRKQSAFSLNDEERARLKAMLQSGTALPPKNM